MGRVLYYDADMKIKYRQDLEVIGVSSFDEAKELLEKEKFDLVGINARRKGAFKFAELVRDSNCYNVVVFIRPQDMLTSDFGYFMERKVEGVITKPRLLASLGRSLKTAKNLKKLVEILDEKVA